MGYRDGDETESFDNVRCKGETAAALLCVVGGDEHWIPKSQLAPESDVQAEDDEGTLVVTSWLAKAKGLVT
jgi:hypothetical protein